MEKRTLGRTGLTVSALGLGTWAIGGEMSAGGLASGYGGVDEAEAARALRMAFDLGIDFFDTSDTYGTGQSERILGEVFGSRRGEVVLAGKFGYKTDPVSRTLVGEDYRPSHRRLKTDYLDLYQLHLWEIPLEAAPPVFDELEQIRKDGLIRAYGWSTDEPACAAFAAGYPGIGALQAGVNVLDGPGPLPGLTAGAGLGCLARSPLAQGLLSGKYSGATTFGRDDVRGAGHRWVRYFTDGRPAPEFLKRLEVVRGLLTSDGRTLVQGALGWILALGPHLVPIPGFKTCAQVAELAGTLHRGPLDPAVMDEVGRVLGPLWAGEA